MKSWTFDMVEERLVEALGFLRRMPDRERGWQRVGTMSLWRQASPTLGMSAIDYVGYMLADKDQAPRMPGLTTAEHDRMEETLGWMEWVAPADRKIVGLGLGQLVGGAARISWDSMLARLGMERGKEGLRRRYGRALARIAARLNAAENRG